MRERMLAGDLYIADDPELAEHMSRAMDLMEAFNASSARDPQLRHRLLTELLGAVGEGTVIGRRSGSTTAATCASEPGRSPTTVSSPWTWRRSPSATTCRSGRTCSS